MREILINKLHTYLSENNPELLLQLEEDGSVTEYLSSKIDSISYLLSETNEHQPAYVMEELCMDLLTRDLRPSKYNYIQGILQDEFENIYQRLEILGTLKFEIINLIRRCEPIFDELGFDEDNRELMYAITGAASEYFESDSEREIVRDELQQSTKATG